jgi:hypothetical protein
MWDNQTRNSGGTETSVVAAAQRRQRLAVGANPRMMVDGLNKPRSGDTNLAPRRTRHQFQTDVAAARLWRFSCDVFRGLAPHG